MKTSASRAWEPLLYDHLTYPAIPADTAAQIGMKVELHPGFEHHSLTKQLVELGVEGDVAQRLLYKTAAKFFKSLYELPGYAPYDLASLVGEDTERGDIGSGGHASEEAVLLDQGHVCPLPRGCYGCYEAGRAAAADYDVISADDGYILFDSYRFHLLVMPKGPTKLRIYFH